VNDADSPASCGLRRNCSRRTNLPRREINFNQGGKWKAAINMYIGTIPPNSDAFCIAEQNMSGCPLL
jgi:hypothetical protein